MPKHPISDRLKSLLDRAASRNPKATTLHAIANAMEPLCARNQRFAALDSADDWEARYDIEGAICWRDPHLRSGIGERAAR